MFALRMFFQRLSNDPIHSLVPPAVHSCTLCMCVMAISIGHTRESTCGSVYCSVRPVRIHRPDPRLCPAGALQHSSHKQVPCRAVTVACDESTLAPIYGEYLKVRKRLCAAQEWASNVWGPCVLSCPCYCAWKPAGCMAYLLIELTSTYF
jgi:hypothetical protein